MSTTRNLIKASTDIALATHKHFLKHAESFGVSIVGVHSIEYYDHMLDFDAAGKAVLVPVYLLHNFENEIILLPDCWCMFANINSISFNIEVKTKNGKRIAQTDFIPFENCFYSSSKLVKSSFSDKIKSITQTFHHENLTANV